MVLIRCREFNIFRLLPRLGFGTEVRTVLSAVLSNSDISSGRGNWSFSIMGNRDTRACVRTCVCTHVQRNYAHIRGSSPRRTNSKTRGRFYTWENEIVPSPSEHTIRLETDHDSCSVTEESFLSWDPQDHTIQPVVSLLTLLQATTSCGGEHRAIVALPTFSV